MPEPDAGRHFSLAEMWSRTQDHPSSSFRPLHPRTVARNLHPCMWMLTPQQTTPRYRRPGRGMGSRYGSLALQGGANPGRTDRLQLAVCTLNSLGLNQWTWHMGRTARHCSPS